MFLKTATGNDKYTNLAEVTHILVDFESTFYIKAWTDHTGSGPTYLLNGSYTSAVDANAAIARLATAIGGIDPAIYS